MTEMIWEHPERLAARSCGDTLPARIVITDTFKRRMFADGRPDQWAVLYRGAAPSLSDVQWWDGPGDGWVRVMP